MREDRRDDLVSTTAIVAGTVAGIAATVLSLLLSSDESVPPETPVDVEALVAPVERGAPVVVVARTSTGEPWTDPRGPERGPDEVEWEVISPYSTYKTIGSMNSTGLRDEAVDRALAELWSYAREHPDDPFIQEMQLRGIRVAQRWAFEGGDSPRAAFLASRFEDQAARALKHDLTALESMRMLVQHIEQRCDGAAEGGRELRRLADRFPNENTEAVLRSGLDAVAACSEESGSP